MRGSTLPLTLLLVLALVHPAAGAGDGGAASWREALVIDTATAHPQKMFEAFDTASLNLYDVDGDGQLEILSVNDNNRVYVIDSRTGGVLSELQTYHYNNSKWPTRELNPIAVGDLYGDGVPCLVVPNSASFLTAFCYDASTSTRTHFSWIEKWRVHVDAAEYEPDFKATHPYLYEANGTAKHTAGMDGHAYLADVDGDHKLEVFVETDSWPGQFSFTHDGKYRWSKSFSDGNAGGVVRDIDKNGVKDAVFFGDGGLVSAYNAKTGGVEWVFDTRTHGATPGSIPVPGLVADLGGDGKYEVVFGARHAVQTNDPDWINQSHARYYALDSKGQLLWNVSYDWMNPLQYQHPAAIDANGDGVLDVAFLDWNTIGHFPGDWNTTNRKSNLFVLDGRDGSVLWHKGISVYWSNKDIVIMDVDGDGDQEIVAPTAKNGCEGLGLYDAKTGNDAGFFCGGDGWGMTRGAVAGDLYGDGKVYLVVPFNHHASGSNYRSLDVGWREGKLVVIETGASKSGVKFSANFQLNDEIDTGLKGTSGTPPAQPVPNLQLRDLVVPASATVGQTVTVTVNATNTGTGPGSGNALIVVNGVERDPQPVTVAAGATQTILYTFNANAAGTLSVSVKLGNATAGPMSVVVSPATTTPPTTTTPPPTMTPGTTPPPTGTPGGTPPTGTPTGTPPVVTAATPPALTPTATPPPSGTPTSTTPDESAVPAPGVVLVLAALAAAVVLARRR